MTGPTPKATRPITCARRGLRNGIRVTLNCLGPGPKATQNAMAVGSPTLPSARLSWTSWVPNGVPWGRSPPGPTPPATASPAMMDAPAKTKAKPALTTTHGGVSRGERA